MSYTKRRRSSAKTIHCSPVPAASPQTATERHRVAALFHYHAVTKTVNGRIIKKQTAGRRIRSTFPGTPSWDQSNFLDHGDTPRRFHQEKRVGFEGRRCDFSYKRASLEESQAILSIIWDLITPFGMYDNAPTATLTTAGIEE